MEFEEINPQFLFADDWFLYWLGDDENVYYQNTELWEEWLDVDEEKTSTEYMKKFSKYYPFIKISKKDAHEIMQIYYEIHSR